MELQGYVLLAVTLILLGYLLPHLVQTRQLLLHSRVEDRFSGDLRIVATAGTDPRQRRSGDDGAAHHRPTAARPYLHDPTRRPEGPMNRPHARSERATQDARALAAARAARAARVSRRAAAARRRLVLTVVLLALTVGAWAGVALTSLAWGLAVVPTLLLAAVLVLGRRAAVAAAERDRRDRAEMARLEARLTALASRSAAVRAERRGAPAGAAGGTAVTNGRSVAGGSRGRSTARETASAERRAAGATAATVVRSASTHAADGPASPSPARPSTPSPTTAPARATGATAEARSDTAAVDPTSGSGPAEPARPAAGTAETAAPATPRPGAEPGGRSEARRAEDAIAEDPRPAPDAGHPAAGTEAEDAPAEDAPTEDTPAGPTSRAGSVASHAGEERWTPVTVPAPSYTLKPTAPRRDVAPFEPDVQPAGQVPHRPTTSTAPTAAAPAQPAAGQAVPQAPAPAQPAAGQVVPQAPALDLDAVLARRRAAGE
ncbi:hypothetical protein MF406_04110 [Georgenia sp. TF02-10]|uniref:hypothetical protein n=1 Tax=Georgenia sp. TF02-10 TaxID=2917725 RepID=UPI001FA6E6B3|nr:hypothetical protein [Georgenia sp. TF02-10]UNX55458.1 hypothetical protein MF406_04110 [Georgenia sp. TF02-10]